jgi:hypothetical protein
MMPTNSAVDEARELLAKATPGPWEHDRLSVKCSTSYLLQDNVSHGDDTYSNFTEDDCALIARAPELLKALSDEVDRLAAENKQLKTCDHCTRPASQTVCDLHEGR